VEGIESICAPLSDLKLRARELTSAGISLVTLLNKREAHLNRENEALKLEALNSAITQELNRVKLSEDSMSREHSQTNFVLSATNLAVGAIKAASGNLNRKDVAAYLLSNQAVEQVTFGNALICVGPNGLPDDVRVVCISKLARDKRRHESRIVGDLRQHGCLLFREEEFSLLISRVTDGIKEGRLNLPIPKDKLPIVTLSGEH
jgi:hypothetical protein